jgi:hypothetical protein
MASSEVERMELKKEFLELDHKLKVERENLRHKNCMERLKKIEKLGLKNLEQY